MKDVIYKLTCYLKPYTQKPKQTLRFYLQNQNNPNPPKVKEYTMTNTDVLFLETDLEISAFRVQPPTQPNYQKAEKQFISLLEMEDLDNKIIEQTDIFIEFEEALAYAIQAAYHPPICEEAAHLFLMRILYQINRLNLFWYDDLQNYKNERSTYLRKIRDQIEEPWQAWELSQMDVESIKKLDVKQALIERCKYDLNPPLTPDTRFMRERMSLTGYRHLLSIASFDGLVEASRLSRIIGGAANEIQATLTRVLFEEYGGGRLQRKHSTFFAQMLAELGLHTEPEAYFNIVPADILASINHNFLLTERKRHFLRYNGGLTYFEIAGPAIYQNYLTAAQRLGLSSAAMGYWELHIKEDERHGKWMLENVALPLAEMYPNDAWELVLGYDQEKLIGERAAKAVVLSIQDAEMAASFT